MRICSEHWNMCKEAIEKYGMSGLIAKDGKEAHENLVADLHGQPDPNNERFDPLMSMHWHWSNAALEAGGLYLMHRNDDGSNDGHYCPLCEWVRHSPNFTAEEAIDIVAQQMKDYCIGEGLIPRLN